MGQVWEKMTPIFIDASSFIASLNKKDPNHKEARRIGYELFQKDKDWVTANIMVYEVYTVVSQKIDKNLAFIFKETVLPHTNVYFVNSEVEEVAWGIFAAVKSKNIGFFDCLAFAVMKKYNIKEAFSFDQDFKKIGRGLGVTVLP